VRAHHFGEGGYDRAEQIIQRLLAENGDRTVPHDLVKVAATGAAAAADLSERQSPESYLGFAKGGGDNANPGRLVRNKSHDYPAVAPPSLSRWTLGGQWTVSPETATLDAPGGRILYRFVGRDLHLVLGPGEGGKPVRFRIWLDGKPPGADHGVDTDAEGAGLVTTQRLYQLVRQKDGARERAFEIEFLDPGVQAYAFTFG
jgi:hypothetical protein